MFLLLSAFLDDRFVLQVTDGVITDKFVLNWLDLLFLLLSSLPANGNIAAEVAFTFELSFPGAGHRRRHHRQVCAELAGPAVLPALRPASQWHHCS